MKPYYRPLIELGCEGQTNAFRLAGGWCWFEQVEVMRRQGGGEIIPARALPEDVLHTLTKPRPAISDVSMDAPRIMGVLNITPDSFSDGGDNFSVEHALHSARKMQLEGVDFLDIGGESTRPGADFIPPEEEIKRVLPVIDALKKNAITAPISIDTRKARVAEKALEAGASIINDVSAFSFDAQMVELGKQTQAPICLMHAQGEPKTMQKHPTYDNVLLSVYDYLEARIAYAKSAGIAPERLIADPGIGFGKTLAHNLALIHGLALFHGLGVPILLGTSRKRFIDHISHAPDPKHRLGGSLASAFYGVSQGIQIYRVHDTYETIQAMQVWQEIKPERE